MLGTKALENIPTEEINEPIIISARGPTIFSPALDSGAVKVHKL